MWAGGTVGAMDGAIEPPGMGLRRVPPADTALPATDCLPLLLLLLLLLLLPASGRHYRGCRVQPGQKPLTPATA